MALRRVPRVVVGLAVASLASAPGLGVASRQAPADRILPVGEYSTAKGKQLATRHDRALRELNAEIHHCLPWLDVKKEGIGFFKPKHMAGDDLRYLALNVIVDQDLSTDFTSMSREDRAARMFSRYVAPLLRRLTRDPAVLRDEQLDGLTVIVSWPISRPQGDGKPPVSETIAVFVPRGVAEGFASGHLVAGDVAQASHVLAWEGDVAVGQLKVTAWEDDFLNSFKPANYEVAKGVTCPK